LKWRLCNKLVAFTLELDVNNKLIFLPKFRAGKGTKSHDTWIFVSSIKNRSISKNTVPGKACSVIFVREIWRESCPKLGHLFYMSEPWAVYPISCEIVAHRENFVERPESYDSFSAKNCIFLVHSLGYIYPYPYITWPKARYQKIPKTFSYYFRSITNLTKFNFPLPRDQTSRSRIWQMISENSSVGLSRLLWTISDICKVSDGTRE
jgi:hypothetical protein